MPKFHVSEDGNPRPCNAQAGSCPLSEADGSATPHGEFASSQDAMAFAEAVNAKRFGGAFSAPTQTFDKSKVQPALEGGSRFKTKTLEGGKLQSGLPAHAEYYEEYGSYQDFKDAGGDFDGYQLELEVITQTFSETGGVLAENAHYERATFEDEDERIEATVGLLSSSDAEDLATNEEILREEWVANNTRVSYRLGTYNLGV